MLEKFQSQGSTCTSEALEASTAGSLRTELENTRQTKAVDQPVHYQLF